MQNFNQSSQSFLDENVKTIFAQVSEMYQKQDITLNDLFKRIAELQVLLIFYYNAATLYKLTKNSYILF
jgi:hypothetical protein